MKHREFKDRLYEELGRVARAIDSPRRLELIDLLAQGERSVEDLAAEATLSMANTSQHLQVLRGARLVETRKQGLRVYYRLAQPEVHEVARAVCPGCRVGVLSGPSFAIEVANGQPTALVAASADAALGDEAVAALHSDNLRIYTSSDPLYRFRSGSWTNGWPSYRPARRSLRTAGDPTA